METELYRDACRAQLLAHLPERFVEAIAVDDDPIAQLWADLDHLNRNPRLPDHHQPPLATWLQNAYLLTTPGEAAREFRRIRHRLVGPARQQEILRSLTRIKKITVSDALRVAADRAAPVAAGELLGGRFSLEKKLGEGAVAEVWRARDLAAGTPVAVKVLKARWAEDAERRARFFAAARQMAAFSHPHIVPVINPEGEDGGRFYCVLEYLDAGDLETALRDGRIRQSTGLRALLRVASGAAAMHAAGVVHLDIKPQNILLGSDGRMMLGDFDRVRLTAAEGGGQTETVDSIFYLAPENFDERRRPGPAADVFSLGMTALFVLHGDRLPAWIVRRPAALLRRIDCPEAVRQVIGRAIALDPGERYGDVEGFAIELEGALGRPSGALPVVAPLISQAPRAVPPSGRTVPPGGRTVPPSGRTIPPSGRASPPSGRPVPPPLAPRSPSGSL
ncbi:MAG: serine/threonine protein kinase, partial [Myxococcales bacterium]|nr:serine/threonine protein kinase [Myxococcales bacterium]